jgi:hypothetical protein
MIDFRLPFIALESERVVFLFDGIALATTAVLGTGNGAVLTFAITSFVGMSDPFVNPRTYKG